MESGHTQGHHSIRLFGTTIAPGGASPQESMTHHLRTSNHMQKQNTRPDHPLGHQSHSSSDHLVGAALPAHHDKEVSTSTHLIQPKSKRRAVRYQNADEETKKRIRISALQSYHKNKNNPTNVSRKKEYYSRPEVKQRRKQQQEFYRSIPEVRDRLKAYHKSWSSRPEVREKRHERQKRYTELVREPRRRARIEAKYHVDPAVAVNNAFQSSGNQNAGNDPVAKWKKMMEEKKKLIGSGSRSK